MHYSLFEVVLVEIKW